MSDSNFIIEMKTELQKAVGGGKTALAEVNLLKPRVVALENSPSVVESKTVGNISYRKWSDGLIEQWGEITNDGFGSVNILTFPVAFLSSYSFMSTMYTNKAANNIYYQETGIESKTNTSITLRYHYNLKGYSWYACGY